MLPFIRHFNFPCRTVTMNLSHPLERGKFQKSPSRIYGAHTMLFQPQISNFIEFGPEMAQRNGAEVCSTRVINENQSCPGKVMA